MQIILVSRTKRVPKTFDLADRRLRYRLAATALAAVLALAGVGATVALAVASPRDRALAEITQLHQQLASRFDSQQAQLSALQSLLLDAKIESNLKPTGMPVDGYISSYFGGRPDPFSGHAAYHTGLDISTPTGTPVRAVAEGMVTFAGIRSGYGDVIEIDHGNGYMTRYAHNSTLVVRPGQRVHVGDVIAKAGSTGRSTGSHVHFEVWYKGNVVNPLAYVRNHR